MCGGCEIGGGHEDCVLIEEDSLCFVEEADGALQRSEELPSLGLERGVLRGLAVGADSGCVGGDGVADNALLDIPFERRHALVEGLPVHVCCLPLAYRDVARGEDEHTL